MTLVLSYVNENFCTIISDRRVSYGSNQEFGFDDNDIKLVKLNNLGWASGSGWVDYLTNLKTKIASTEIENTSGIVKIYKDVSESLLKSKPDHAEDIDNSCVVLSWLSENFTIGILSRQLSRDSISFLNTNQLFILYPADYQNDESKVEKLEKKIRIT